MRILYHHRTAAEDGQAVHIRALQQAFVELGHTVEEVSLVRQAGAQGGAQRTRWGWVAHVPRWTRELMEYGYSFSARRRLMQAAARFEPDCLYERYAFGNLGGVLAARDLGLPIVLEVNSPMVLELERTRGLSFPRIAARVEREVLRRATLVCAVSGVLAQMLIELGADPARTIVTPNGVELARYAWPDRAAVRAAARARLLPPGTPADALVLGFVGYYRAWHRLDLAVQCLARPELAHAQLVLVGEGPARAEIEAAARAAGVEARVHYTGRVGHAEVPDLLPGFDVALLPAINPYASPLKLHEYMAAGLSCVCPDQPNLREVLQHGESALLFARDDGASLFAALAALARDAHLAARLGQRARELVLERDLTWAGNARRVLAALEARR